MNRAGGEKAETWDAFRQLLAEQTQGKLILLTVEETERMIGENDAVLTYHVNSPDDLAPMRHAIRIYIEGVCLPSKRLFHYLVAVNEAATNALLYGKNVSVQILQMKEEPFCRIAVSDCGEGIPFGELPKAVLLRGYSKRNTLGVGFPVMLHYTDRLWLSTSQNGTVLMLDLALDLPATRKVKM
ncbi:ATP-binding protein [Brevibacillus fluminis]|uniref:ATP-binding protein n=1 Tax=Brevibacillus fluminis TaxID=511487 RepID=UPI001606D4C0|nr:ATP-binding protein [Brevibacillus fluminis]